MDAAEFSTGIVVDAYRYSSIYWAGPTFTKPDADEFTLIVRPS